MTYKSFLLHMAQHRRYRYQRASPVCCVRGLLTAATLNFLLCFGIELPGNGIGFASFILYCCPQNHLLPGTSPLLFDSKERNIQDLFLCLVIVSEFVLTIFVFIQKQSFGTSCAQKGALECMSGMFFI